LSDFARAALAPARSVEPVWTYDADLFSRITVGDDWVAVAADNKGTRTDVVLDLATGNELWDRPASTSAIFSGYGPLPPVVIGDAFINLEPIPDSDYITMVAVHVRTGNTLWRLDDSAYLTSQPEECDNGNVCGSAFWDDVGGRQNYEIDIVTGDLISSVAGGEGLDGSVEMERDDVAERFVRYDADGSEIWSVDLDTAFGRDVEPSLGWSTDWVEDDDVFIAYVPSATSDFADNAVIGLEYSTGDVRWVRDGRSSQCWDSIDIEDDNVWCAHTGRIDFDASRTIVGYSEVTTEVEVFDPATGETIGALDVEPTPGWDGVGDYQPPAKRLWALLGGIAAQTPAGVAAIDFETGEEIDLPSGQVGWCDSPWSIDFDTSTVYFAGYSPCVIGDNARAQLDEPVLPASVIESAGSVVGDTVVIVREGRVRAYAYTDGL